MRNIIDISNYQGDIDFAKIAKQIDGAIIRCGITFWGNFVPSEDVRWEKNYAGFKAAGVPVGAYYLGVAKKHCAGQAGSCQVPGAAGG